MKLNWKILIKNIIRLVSTYKKGMNKMTDEKLQDYERLIATFQEKFDYENVYDVIDVTTSIYGYNEKTLDNINYYLTGYNSYEQLKEIEGEE